MKSIVSTQIRIPANLYDKVKQEADEIGISYNAHLMELIFLGMKVRNGKVVILPEQ